MPVSEATASIFAMPSSASSCSLVPSPWMIVASGRRSASESHTAALDSMIFTLAPKSSICRAR